MALIAIQIIAVIGFLLSAYALYVERKVAADASYKAVCDFRENMSCGKVLSSPEGHLAGVSNALVGIFYYLFIFVFGAFTLPKLVFYLAVASVLGSIYLAYLQYIKMKNFCLVCTGIYVASILLVIFSYLSL